MTAPDPRVGEIEARLSASPAHVANARFGDVLRIVWTTYYFGADLQWHNARSGDVENAETLTEEIEASEGDWGWMTAPADVAFLLAELRKAREALDEYVAKYGEHTTDNQGRGCPACAADIRVRARERAAAVAAAKGDE